MTNERLNQYVCGACGFTVTTIDVDEGATPMILGSHKYAAKLRGEKADCPGRMISRWYRIEGNPAPDFEWFKPTSVKGYSRDMKEHIRSGGLDIRRVSSLRVEA